MTVNRKNRSGRSHAGLRSKLFLSFLLFSGALLFLLWLFLLVFLNQFYQQTKIAEIRRIAGTLETDIHFDTFENTIRELSESKQLSVSIFDPNGKRLFFAASPDSARFSAFQSETLWKQTEAEGGERMSIYESAEAGHGNRGNQGRSGMRGQGSQSGVKVLRLSRITKTEQPLLLVLQATITPLESTVSTLRQVLVILSVFMVLFSVVLAQWIARWIARPIEDVNAGTKQLKEGNYAFRFDAQGYREIEELSDSLNDASAELSQVETLRKELIANVSHDLRTPLTLIEGYAEMMRDIPGENNEENAQVILDETRRLSVLVKEMLDLSQVQSRSRKLHIEKWNLTKRIGTLIGSYEELLRRRGYRFEWQYQEECTVEADAQKIDQVLRNLINNAVNYAGEDKRIVIRQTVQKDAVRIEVTEFGAGIPKEDLPHIWERYYRSNQAHNRPVSGTGLGLSIVKSVVTEHGGTYGVDSEPGKGSTFYFTLPKKQRKKELI